MNNNFSLYLGDCVDVLRGFEDGSVDAIVTDPPYGLTQSKGSSGGFMGKRWDADVPSVDIWAECLRVLKPGGNLLCFAGTRTQHRMVARIVESGFTLQDIVLWSYGSGFPKSLSIGKAIDKKLGAERTEVIGSKLGRPGMAKDGSNQSFDSSVNTYGKGGILSTDITAPATEVAKKWEGWGTALKPSFEPVSIYTKGDSFTLHNEFKRLYYCAKASKKERNLGLTSDVTNGHPTVKPLKLMEQLCELATPKGGVILDPFMGSGTTGIAALNLGFNFVGIDMVEEYFDIAQLRLSNLFPQDQ